MKRVMAITLIFYLLLIPTLIFSADNFKASLTKETYSIGEDVSIIISVINPNQQETVINWYIIFYPELSKRPVTLTGGKTFAAEENFISVHKIKAENVGNFKASIKFVDSDDNLIDEKELTFSVKQNFWPYLIVISIISVLVIFFVYYRKSKEKIF